MKDKVLFVAILGLAITGVSFAIADPFDLPLVYAQVSQESEWEYNPEDPSFIGFVEPTPTGTEIFQDENGLDIILDYDKNEIFFTSNSTSYKIIPDFKNTDTNNMMVSVGSHYAFLNGETCTVDYYSYTDELLYRSNWIVSVAELNTDNWSELNINNSQCTISTNGVESKIVRENDEGIFTIKVKVIFNTIKTTTDFENKIFPNHKFAYQEVITLNNSNVIFNDQEIDLTDYWGAVFDRQTLEQFNDVSISLLGNGTSINYKSDVGFQDIWAVYVTEPTEVILDYANVGETQTQIGQTFTVDPVVWGTNTGSDIASLCFNTSGVVYSSAYSITKAYNYNTSCDYDWYRWNSGVSSGYHDNWTKTNQHNIGFTDNFTTKAYIKAEGGYNKAFFTLLDTDGNPMVRGTISSSSSIRGYDSRVYCWNDAGTQSTYVNSAGGQGYPMWYQTFDISRTSGTILIKALEIETASAPYSFRVSCANTKAIGGWQTTHGTYPYTASGGVVYYGYDNLVQMIHFTPSSLPPPQAPTNLTITQTTANQLDLSWSPPSSGMSASGYKIERSLDNSSWTVLTSNTGNTNTTYTNSGLNPNTLYYYRVTTYSSSAGSYSSGSVTSSETTWDYPEQVTGLIATSGEPISLSWNVPNSDAPITSYKVYRDGVFIQSVTSGTTTTDAPQYGVSYTYTVSAVSSVGEGTQSSGSSATRGVAPDPPTGVSTSINNPNPNPFDITVSWSAPANVGSGTLSGFEIYRDGSLVTTVGLVTSYTDTVPSVGTYSYTVRAVSNHGVSTDSNSSQISTPNTPDAPTTSTAINDPDNLPFDVTVSFTAPANDGGSAITGYNIYSSSDDLSYTLEASNVNTPQIVTVPSAGTWYFKTSAVNNAGIGTQSSASSINTPSVPDVPPSITLSIDTPDPSPLTITVTASPPTSDGGSAITGYNFYSSPDDITYTLEASNASNPQLITVSSAGVWYFKVEAVNNVGSSALSGSNLIGTPTVPSAVDDLAFTSSTTTTLSVNWTAPDNGGSAITLYKMFVDGVQVDTTTFTTYTFTGLTTKTNYDFTIVTTNNVGDSSVSNTLNETVWGVPDAVTNLTTSSTLSSITINYDAAVPYGYPVTGYKLERESPVGGGFTIISANIGNVTSYTNTGLAPVTEYNYRITPLSSIGDGVSATINYTTLPPAPTGLTASSTITGNMDLSWTAPSPSTGVTGYHIQRADGVGNAYATIVADTGNTNTTYTDTGLTQGIVYVYRVAAITSFGESTYSNTYSMTTYYLPNAVEDLTVTTNNLLQFVLNWSQPTLYGTFTGYQLNYTTPAGVPQTIYSSSIQDTNQKISGFDPTVEFSFRVAPITIHGTNATGNIVNSTVTSQIEIGDISVSGQASPDTRDIVFTMETLDNNTNLITATFDPALELNCEISQPALGTTQDYPSISETLDGADAYHEFIINNEAGNIVEIDCHDTTDNTITASYTLRTDQIGNNTTDSILSIQQIKDFTDGTLGGSDSIGGVSLIILAVGIIGMIGFNRTHPAIGIGMFVVVMGGARYFNLIGDVEGIIGIIALIIVLGVAGAERYTRG